MPTASLINGTFGSRPRQGSTRRSGRRATTTASPSTRPTGPQPGDWKVAGLSVCILVT